MAEAARKFERIIWEFEVEVVDEVAMRSKLLELDDELAEGDVARAVGSILPALAHEILTKHGLRMLGGSILGRSVDDEGDYAEEILPRLPGRDEDGGLRATPGLENDEEPPNPTRNA